MQHFLSLSLSQSLGFVILNNKNFLKSFTGYKTEHRRVSIVTADISTIMFRSQRVCPIIADVEHTAHSELGVTLLLFPSNLQIASICSFTFWCKMNLHIKSGTVHEVSQK
jgi:hypothetical protein